MAVCTCVSAAQTLELVDRDGICVQDGGTEAQTVVRDTEGECESALRLADGYVGGWGWLRGSVGN